MIAMRYAWLCAYAAEREGEMHHGMLASWQRCWHTMLVLIHAEDSLIMPSQPAIASCNMHVCLINIFICLCIAAGHEGACGYIHMKTREKNPPQNDRCIPWYIYTMACTMAFEN